MKKYLMLFSLFFAYNAWAMEEAKQAYEELYREFPNGYEDKMAKHEYRKDNLQKLITIARKHVTDLDSRTQPKSFFFTNVRRWGFRRICWLYWNPILDKIRYRIF